MDILLDSEKERGVTGLLYLSLFVSFFQVGLFSFGGGYASLPLIQEQVVQAQGWLTAEEFTDVLTISQMTPGPIAINAATFVGTKIAGPGGAIMATLGCITPCCIISIFLAYLFAKYQKMEVVQGILQGLRPGVAALIAFSAVGILQEAFWPGGEGFLLENGVLFLLGLVALRGFALGPIWVMAGCGVFGAIYYGLQ